MYGFNNPRHRKFPDILPRIGEIFSASQTGLQGFGFQDGQPDDGPEPPPDIEGIQTQSGINIETQGGNIIQAEGQ